MGEQTIIHSDRERLPAMLKMLRAKLGLPQAEMARRCGVTLNTYARWERSEIRPPVLIITVFAFDEPISDQEAG